MSKRFDEDIRDRALARVTGALLRNVLRPQVESVLSVFARPRFRPPHPYPLKEFFLQSRVTGKFRREFNIGNWTEYQSLRQVPNQTPRATGPKLRIVLPNIQENRRINDPSHGVSFTHRLPAVLPAPHPRGAGEDHALWRSLRPLKDRVE